MVMMLPLKVSKLLWLVSFNKESLESCISGYFDSIPQCSCLRDQDTELSIMRCSCLDEFTCPVPDLQSSCRRIVWQRGIKIEFDDPWRGWVPSHKKVWDGTPVDGPPRRNITRHINPNSPLCFAWISLVKGPKTLCWKTTAFHSFHMFQSRLSF